MRRILVAGCGYVGAPLAGALAAEGREVWGLRRSHGVLPEGVTPLIGDLTRPDTLHGAPPELDAVVFCAARGGSGGGQSYEEVFVDGQRNLAEAVRGSSPNLRRWLFVSSTGVYGHQGGGWVDETTATEPTSEAGRWMLAAESVARDALGDVVVLRLAGIYGPGRARLVRGVRDRTLALPPDDGGWLNQIHRDDCVGAIRHLLLHAAPASLYLGCDELPAPRREVLAWLAQRIGVDLPQGDEGRPTGRQREGRGDKRVNGGLLRAAGYSFRYPTYREGYEQVLGCAEGA